MIITDAARLFFCHDHHARAPSAIVIVVIIVFLRVMLVTVIVIVVLVFREFMAATLPSSIECQCLFGVFGFWFLRLFNF